MHDVSVKLKDGATFQSPLWTWRPDLGWFTLVGVERIFRLADVESAVQHGVRRREPGMGMGPLYTSPVDLLERARKEGWNGS
jgi:hypothetical protein